MAYRDSRFGELTNRSPLLAQILQQMQQQSRFQPQSYGALAAGLGASYFDQKNLQKELAKEQAQKEKQSSDLAKALSKYTHQSEGGPVNIPLDRVDGGTEQLQQNYMSDPKGARQTLLGSLTQNESPMAQGLAGQLMAQQFAAPPAPEKVDLGNEIAFMQNGQIVGRMPKGVSPDTKESQEGADRRHGTASGDTLAREAGEESRFNRVSAGTKYSADRAEGNRGLRDTQSLRKEFEGLQSVQAYQKVLPQLQGIAKAPDTPAGDLVIVNGVAKIMDPDSAIRQEEFESVFRSTSPMEAALGKVRFAVNGKGRLTAESKRQLLEAAEAKISGFKSAYDRDHERYSGYASQMGTDPSQVVGSRVDAALLRRGAVRIESDAEWEQLAPGTRFIGPDGVERTK